jgi:uncharacterized protein (TIGR02599 family)
MRPFFPRRSSARPAGIGWSRQKKEAAFSLLEILITFALVMVIMVTVLEVVTSVEHSWKTSADNSFTDAEDALSIMAQSLASATLEPYEDYADNTGAFRISPTATFVPDHLARRSDLDFVCGPTAGTNGLLAASGRTTSGCGVFFLAPQGYTQTVSNSGMERLLNAKGYFVEFGNESDAPSFLLNSTQRWRWRLKQVQQPAESLQIFNLTSSSAWIQQLVSNETTTPTLAENVVTLIILPVRTASDTGAALSSDYRYDSRDATNSLTHHQLPTRLRIAFMAIDEASAQILAAQNGTNSPALVASTLFQKATQLDADLATLDGTLTAQKIRHRLFEREILLPAAAWSNTPSL